MGSFLVKLWGQVTELLRGFISGWRLAPTFEAHWHLINPQPVDIWNKACVSNKAFMIDVELLVSLRTRLTRLILKPFRSVTPVLYAKWTQMEG